jgi:polysaccharide pyruvyl transferase WcaK-like protein
LIYRSDWCFIGGTNIISSKLNPYGLWRVSSEDARVFGSTRTVLLGAGWNDYQSVPSPFTSKFLRTALSHSIVHSVRDNYTREKLFQIGIGAVGTSCMTTWGLTPSHCLEIPKRKAQSVVTTITEWRKEPEADKMLLALLKRHYRKVYFFPQQESDAAYLDQLGYGDLPLASTTSQGYTEFLRNEDVDFIGTRLHGGIRALQTKRRALILAVDNRAAEISRDTGLPVVARTDEAAITDWIEGGRPTTLDLPVAAIEEWKAQFRGATGNAQPAPVKAPRPKPDWKRAPLGWELVKKVQRATWGRM